MTPTARSRPGGLIHYLRAAVLPRDGAGQTDGQLLERFLAERDGAAFTALVRRHGPMVLGVCRRVLREAHDAEDAFQATFLVLVRRAASVAPREAVGNWLYGVAYRTALGARRGAARRRAKEREVAAAPRPEPRAADVWDELRPALDEELSRLPEKYRLPVVLCDLEGRSRRDVARQLNLPEGTLSSRLAAARKKLADRLARRGLALSAGALAALLSQGAAPACLPVRLVGSTVQAALAVAAGEAVAGGVVSANAAALADGVVRAMVMSKVKNSVLGLLLLGAGIGGGDWACRAYSAVPAAAGGTGLVVTPDDDEARQRAEAAQRRAEEAQRRAEAARREAEQARREAEAARRQMQAEEREDAARKRAKEKEETSPKPEKAKEETGRKPEAKVKRRGEELSPQDAELARAKEQIEKLQAEIRRLHEQVERLQKQLQDRPRGEGGDAAKAAAKARATAAAEKGREKTDEARRKAEAKEREERARRQEAERKEQAARREAEAKRRGGEPATAKAAPTPSDREIARLKADVVREMDRLKAAIERLQKQMARPKTDDRDAPKKKPG